jgi:nucleoside-diphosphate-sugar epimerase
MVDMRSEAKDAIFLTGATGALGSELLRLLTASGWHVICLARAQKGQSAAARIAMTGAPMNLVTVVSGDISLPMCGLTGEALSLVSRRANAILHCAGSIKFDNPALNMDVNVEGVRNILAVADTTDVAAFHHVSTMYVGGTAGTFSESDGPDTCAPSNSYEETKQMGERLVYAWSAANPAKRCGVYRPSILVGRADGTTPTFDAYYGFMQPYFRATELLRRRPHDKLPPEVRIDRRTGEIHLPFAVRMSLTAPLNLICIDWVAAVMIALLDAPWQRETFHLADPAPLACADILGDVSFRALGIIGHTLAGSAEAKQKLLAVMSPGLRQIQRRVDAIVDQYEPYVTRETIFSVARAAQILGDRFQPPPAMNERLIIRMLAYAVENGWGDVDTVSPPAIEAPARPPLRAIG